MLKSMTGFASATGTLDRWNWTWELRSVNGKGLDLRLRVPDWIDGLEIGLRKALTAVAARGNVTLSLRITREEDAAGSFQINDCMLQSVLDAMAVIEAQAMDAGLSLAPSKASDIVAMRGILDQKNQSDQDTKPLAKALLAQASDLIQSFDAMRQSEGAALETVLNGQLSEIGVLTTAAEQLAQSRSTDVAATLQRNLAKIMENADGFDETRVAQELALMAVKADITEEIDRLVAHVNAAQVLLAEAAPIGRKMDFLMQEFNREANTLCSKAQNAELTRIGLALKVLIDQMREQVQNVE
jgi:uncharacterized protein (TIGR00255 family)|tara:strand:+ start:2260 stop:3156 length:897 start_codon:yes stop_codon:yes gene_type:complete